MKPLKKQSLNIFSLVVLKRMLLFSCAALIGHTFPLWNIFAAEEVVTNNIYPEITTTFPTQKCMQCHPVIANLLHTKGSKHSHVECRQCHLQVHAYFQGKTNYEEILPKCTRCHNQPHGENLTDCSSCHQEAHAPLEIPASRALSQGCYVCHPELDKDIKIFPTKHTYLYCTACHHTKHGFKPECRECHQPHKGRIPAPGAMNESTNPMDQCTSCHPPHRALKVEFPDETEKTTCAVCHRKVYEMLERKHRKHSELLCVKCHPGQHKTIKRCKECHGEPHPEGILKKKSSCGGCHGIAHSVVR